jgi:hypothetical protein
MEPPEPIGLCWRAHDDYFTAFERCVYRLLMCKLLHLVCSVHSWGTFLISVVGTAFCRGADSYCSACTCVIAVLKILSFKPPCGLVLYGTASVGIEDI